jgi:hypothetical protein
MIVFDLSCTENHRFEGWFASPEEYARQEGAGLLACPVCGTSTVRKLPSSKVRTTAATEPQLVAPPARASRASSAPPQQVTFASFIEQIVAGTEDVGRAFPEEARKIHYDEAPRRPIRGVATPEEARELADEGIPVMSLPIPPRGQTH